MQRSQDGYNPCPHQVVAAIAAQVAPAPSGTLLDSVAGEGGAAIELAAAWNLSPTFIELHPARAQRCLERGAGPVHVGSAEDAELDGHPSVWYFNPPWDPADPEGYLEAQLFAATAPYALSPQTLAVILLPSRALEMPHLYEDVARSLDRIAIRAFPDPYYGVFDQMVIFGYGRTTPGTQAPPAPDRVTLSRLRANELRYEIPAWNGTPLDVRMRISRVRARG